MSQPDLEDEFLTVAQVAETLKLNQQTVRNWIDQGSLPAVRVGRRVRIRRSDFEQVLANGYSRGGGGGASRPGRPGGGTRAPTAGPSAEDFWGGEPIGAVDPPPGRGGGP
jgi:excisionase family DNA binding protein